MDEPEITEEHVELLRQHCRAWAIQTYGSVDAAWPAVNELQHKVRDAMRGHAPELQHLVMVALLECQIRMTIEGSKIQ